MFFALHDEAEMGYFDTMGGGNGMFKEVRRFSSRAGNGDRDVV